MPNGYRFDGFELRPSERLLLVDGVAVPVGGRAFDLLTVLVECSGRPLTKAELIRRVWGDQDILESNLHVQIAALRGLLGPGSIATIPNQGYRLTRVPLPDAGANRPGNADATFRDHYRFGAVEIRPRARQLLIDGLPAAVGARAFDVLLALVEHRGRLLSKDFLLDCVWRGLVVEENNLQAQISTLRKLLGPQAIATVPGFGYKFTLPSSDEEPTPTTAAGHPAAAQPPPLRLSNVAPLAESLYGRVAAISDVSASIDEHPLTTLVGPGGIGKTSLARSVARERLGRHADGVWWVDLAVLAEPARVAAAVAQVVGARLGEGDPVAQLAGALASRRVLLFFDNCEHLSVAVAEIIETLLRQSPGVRVVATSQEPLKVTGECVIRLDTLAVPPHGCSVDEARTYGALQLFEQRARSADRRFVLDAASIEPAITLCERLDGIPLAIEMAVARLRLLGLTALLDHLDDRLRVLKSDRRSVPAGQQTLRSTLDWSHSLLDDDERTVLRRLSVFAGPFRLEAAQRVGRTAGLDDWGVVDALSGLVDKSLVQVRPSEPPRYRLLETTRLYAAERLTEAGDRADALRSHSIAMAEIAEDVERDYWLLPDQAWFDSYVDEYADLDAAFERAGRGHDAATAAPTLDALFRLDHLRALLLPIRRHQVAAALLQGGSPSARARLQLRAAFNLTSPVAGIEKNVEAVAACRQTGSPFLLHEALLYLAEAQWATGHPQAAAASLAEARALCQAGWSARRQWWMANYQCRFHASQGDGAAYAEVAGRELAFARAAQSPCQIGTARVNIADAALMREHWDEAVELLEAAVADNQPFPSMLVTAKLNLLAALLRLSRVDEARREAREVLPMIWPLPMVVYFFPHLALLAAELGEFERAAGFVGHLEAVLAQEQRTLEPNEQFLAMRAAALSRAALGDRDCEQANAAGADWALPKLRFEADLLTSGDAGTGAAERAARRRDKRTG